MFSNGLLIFAGLGLVFSIVAITVARLRYRNSVGFKVFSLNIVTVVLTSVTSAWLAETGFNTGTTIAAVAILISFVTIAGFQGLRTVTIGIERQTRRMISSVAQIAAASEEASAIAEQQAATGGQVSTTLEHISKMSKRSSEAAQQVLQASSDALEHGRRGVDALNQTNYVLQHIGKVTEIVDMVNELTEQSNLLAVNASIEAAKAGEQGRGFSIVANEMRRLATQSKEATVRIADAIRKTEEGRKATELVGAVVQDIVRVLEETTDKARYIYKITDQESHGYTEISDAMHELVEGSTFAASGAKQLEQAISDLSVVGKHLQKYVKGTEDLQDIPLLSKIKRTS